LLNSLDSELGSGAPAAEVNSSIYIAAGGTKRRNRRGANRSVRLTRLRLKRRRRRPGGS
jgi:hypothetical protein